MANDTESVTSLNHRSADCPQKAGTENDEPLFLDRMLQGPADPGDATPSAMPQRREHPKVWVVALNSGDRIRVLADSHHTYVRPSGEELRFTNTNAESGLSRGVATIVAGTWSWCVEEAAHLTDEGEEGQ